MVYAGNPAPLYHGPVHLGGGSPRQTTSKTTPSKPAKQSQARERSQPQSQTQTAKTPSQAYTTVTVKMMTGRVVTYRTLAMR